MPQPISDNLKSSVQAEATRVGMDPALACAIVEQESSWNCWALRYEPAFDRHYEANRGFSPTEEVARSISWGLFQLMGENARSLGYTGDLPALCQPEIGIPLGIKFFLIKLKAAKGDVSKALQLWNGGGNPTYASEVMARIDKYR